MCGAFFVIWRSLYLPAPVPLPGPTVEPLGEGLMEVVPDGFTPLLCAAPALPAWLLMPLLPTVLPVVVPGVVVPVEEPAELPELVVPGLVVAPGEVALPPVEVDCAIASVLVRASAAASPSVAFLMNYSLCWWVFPTAETGFRSCLAGQSVHVLDCRNLSSHVLYLWAGMVMAATLAMTSTRPSARLAGTVSPSSSTERPTPIGMRK